MPGSLPWTGSVRQIDNSQGTVLKGVVLVAVCIKPSSSSGSCFSFATHVHKALNTLACNWLQLYTPS